MKKGMLAMMLIGGLGLGNPYRSAAQSHEIQQLVLNWEKLEQLRQILSDLKKGYTILKTGYEAIRDISQGNFTLHKVFLDELMQVNPAVKNYYKVTRIANYQLKLVQEYKEAYQDFKESGNFHPDEIAYLARVYNRLLRESLRNLDELVIIITAGDLRMSDDERLQAIDRIYNEMEDKLEFLRYFNGEASLLDLQREKERKSTERLQKMYGLD